jgi:hypothetical protein
LVITEELLLLAIELEDEETTLDELEETTTEEELLETTEELTALLEIEEIILLEELEEAILDELADAAEEDTVWLLFEDDLELFKDDEISEKEKPPKLLLDEVFEPSAKLKPAKLFFVEDFKELN